MDLGDKPVAVSEEYLTKMVDELVHNAFKFSKAGTKVKVTLASADSDPALTLSVTDNGRGLETEHIRKGGSLHAIRSQDAGTTGFGARADHSQAIGRTARGTLLIQSEVGKGTTVVVKLPLAA